MGIWTPSTQCLTRLNEGAGRPPLYLPHAVGGTVGFFKPVARRLADLRTVFGLACHGLSRANEPDRTIGEMAQRYVDVITANQPEGPYEVVGYSMGGFTAVEIAHRLRARGHAVALVGLLDVPPPGTPRPTLSTAQALGLISRAIGFAPPFAGAPELSRELLLAQFLAEALERSLVPPGFQIEDLRRMVEIYGINARAMDAYRPDRYPGDIHCLFTGRDRATRFGAGWREYVAGTVHVDQFEADHFALMQQHPAQVTETVRGWITRCRAARENGARKRS